MKAEPGFQIIAGPCSVESRQQIVSIAREVKEAGATMLRGGAFKPRTSPYDFQGLKEEGLAYLVEAGRAVGLPVVSEITTISQLDLFRDVDVLQVGARNMQNYELLLELGRSGKKILIKRGMASTLEELLMSAEYIMKGGSQDIILCERGIRTFSRDTRNTLDLSAVPVLKQKTQLPVIVDPSHGTGHGSLVPAMAMAACGAGADGVMIEVHNHPDSALTDGEQAITPEQLVRLVGKMKKIVSIVKEENN